MSRNKRAEKMGSNFFWCLHLQQLCNVAEGNFHAFLQTFFGAGFTTVTITSCKEWTKRERLELMAFIIDWCFVCLSSRPNPPTLRVSNFFWCLHLQQLCNVAEGNFHAFLQTFFGAGFTTVTITSCKEWTKREHIYIYISHR